ncbi:endolytic transglycosylase MltG [Actinotalea sp.]|uniref:endolytic transglycosylase MltG n=1 Tax=Actinotalea sp. TaxID=1872145 RepID=UPI0035650DAA
MNDAFLDEIVRSGEPGGPGRRRDGRAQRDRRRRQRRRRNLIALLLSVLLLGGAAYAVITFALPTLSGITGSEAPADDYPGPGEGSVDVVIPAGATGAQMAQALVEADVVKTARAFTDAFTADPDAAGIQPGTYRLRLQMRGADAVAALLDSSFRVQTKVTIPEGLRVDQVLEKLSSVTDIPVETFETAMEDTAATGLPAESGGNYEGWLFASTYTFEPGTTPVQMVAAMVSQTVAILDARSVAAEDRERILTIASLIEREARTAEDRAKVARAIQNRLDIDMKLDIDASVAYGAGKPGTELTQSDLDTDTPYNLYLHTGLPPTPIAAPSEMSIDAALNPADGTWLFWVTVDLDTGETRFATTYAEHLENVQVLREWQAAQPTDNG